MVVIGIVRVLLFTGNLINYNNLSFLLILKNIAAAVSPSKSLILISKIVTKLIVIYIKLLILILIPLLPSLLYYYPSPLINIGV